MRKPSMAALIEILKQQKLSTPPKNWDDLEDHVKYVYETLLKMEGEEIVVARDVQMRGTNGQSHQIDVYYEFEKVGIRHRVAIECKNSKRRVEKSDAMVFWAKINDCPGVMGIMISSNGYQEGADKFAADHGVIAMTLDDLPSLSYLLAMRLEKGTIPDEKTVGEPFWTLFELEEGKLTGAPYGHTHGNEIMSILFFSKKQAEDFRRAKKLEKDWGVRGLSQLHLRNFILTVDSMAGRYVISEPLKDQHGKTVHGGFEISRSDLISEYYLGDASIPSMPMVMPSRQKFSGQ
jgi:hypothetical protein